jgi:hypothetical protein
VAVVLFSKRCSDEVCVEACEPSEFFCVTLVTLLFPFFVSIYLFNLLFYVSN